MYTVAYRVLTGWKEHPFAPVNIPCIPRSMGSPWEMKQNVRISRASLANWNLITNASTVEYSLIEWYVADITWPRGDTKFLSECRKILRTSEIFFQHEKRNFVSPSDHVIFYLLYKHQWNAKPFYLKSFLVWKVPFIMKPQQWWSVFTCEDNMLFSHLKITCYFHIWRYQVFARKLTWYFIGV